MMAHKYSVVFAGDYGYIRQIETALKSLIYHNNGLKVYIFNQDIPKEWFDHYKNIMRRLGGDLVDVKLLNIGFDQKWTITKWLPHINYMTFARYYIPQFVDEDKVLYLDSDLIVTGDLTSLFNRNIEDYYLAAARSTFHYGIGFNAGVLLVNNKRWKEENIQEKLIDLTNREFANIPEGDQSILNMLVQDKYLLLDDIYNFQIGFDLGAATYQHHDIFEISIDPLPKILHYISGDKPWNTFSTGRLRDVWWKYHLMEWSEILDKWHESLVSLPEKEVRGKLLILTDSYQIQHLGYLVEQLPEYEFHITAFTEVADNLKRFISYDNVYLYPSILRVTLDTLIDDCDALLDIAYGDKNNKLIDIMKLQKPVFTFENVAADLFSGYIHNNSFSPQNPDEFVTAIKDNINRNLGYETIVED
ncbi:glycosyltransferase [Streptococcus pluranimalium]|uniref:glycosyltransferase family 8 protein n=1 Tax=Streptococcus pluranimalium TaxID=82348 RepID=UPI003F68DC37